jgi:hypothetical protein
VTDNEVRGSYFRELTNSLKALASEPSDQLALFPDSAFDAGDLVARFDDSLRALYEDYESDLSRSQVEALRALSGRIAAISRDGSEFDAELWTEQAVRTSAHWREVRQLAGAALSAFDVDEWSG